MKIGLNCLSCIYLLLVLSCPVYAKLRPNFVIIFTDDQGYQDLGCFGAPDIKTPRIDQMAQEGMRFTNFYAQTVCGPSRAALMTGCYPLRVARHADPDSIHPELHLDEITIAEVLKAQGYATGAFGKWDLAGHNQVRYKSELLPPYQGFDTYFGTPGSNDRSVNLIRDTKMVEKKVDMSTLTKCYTDEAIGFIEKSKDVPFFVYLAHTMPHTKLAVSEEFKDKSAGGFYGDVIEEIDFNVGRVLDKVKELGLDDNTYIIFTSDNGPWLIRKEHGGHADPLRSGKTSCWEGGLRVPCIMRAPGRIPAGTECDAVAATIDMMPTLAKLAGGAVPSDRVIDGVDISALMHGQIDSLQRNYFYYQHDCLRAVRSGKWKLMLPHTEPVKTSIATKWKNHIAKADAIRIETPMLFDLEVDIGETTDVADKYPEELAKLLKLAEWAQNDIGDHNRFGVNARSFGAKRRTLSKEGRKISGFDTTARPNVIFILMDDMGYSDVSCYGATKVQTPNIDRMAAEGMRFTDFHAAASICSPSRAAFLTGAYPQRCGLYMGINPNREAHWFLGLNPDETTIAEQFKKQGYVTGMVGKWHLGTEEKFSYFHQGFDYYYGAPCNMGHDPRFFDGRKVIYEKSPLDQLTTLYTERVVQQIQAHKDKPFFIYYAHNYPHTPYQAGAKFKGSSQDGVRGDVIQELDWSIGEIRKALEASNILDKTMVIFTSDNGPVKSQYAKPYSGTKYVSMEGGHRVPFIVYWKGGIKAPAVVDVPVHAMDLFPTLSELSGASMPADRVFDGVSLTPLFQGEAIARSTEEPFYYYNCENLQCVRVGDWKLHLPRSKEQFPFWSMNKQKEITRPQLYNLAADAAEKKDVAVVHPERVAEMMTLAEATRLKLGEYMKRGSEQRPTGTLFPEVPIVSNHVTDWITLSAEEKGRAKTEFKAAQNTNRKRKQP